ncbi:Regulatory protein GntR, HTH:GntR, C-terminal [Sulfitobacter noctilucae]|uniref:GntR family transcriptional regulator n=1 Tax=Sulfitobacter noctilucae TaxID=1342302 RepID=UPI0004699E9A|nr:GntR family transcriptional regulator [Sulfitobacter noctilucae]KIN60519.1 Regulatory protein GntR, HTH:GntR, C-terminal [Sulfitobacter noctilucae]
MVQRRADNISAKLEELIFNGSFADGDRLDEVRLAAHFGVSRTPLREALQRLALTGLIELIPRRGAFVRQPGAADLLEMFELMAELEASCGRLAAARISDAALDDLHVANVECQAAIDAGDVDRYYTENEGFHRIIYRHSGNRFLEQEAARLHDRLKPFRRQQLRLRGRMKQSMAEHEAIVAALVAGEPLAAAEALRTHVAQQGGKFQDLMAAVRNAAE